MLIFLIAKYFDWKISVKKVKPFLESVMQGINFGIFVIGSTGSGKSYTLEGTNVDPGLIHHFVEGLFKAISNKQNQVFVFNC